MKTDPKPERDVALERSGADPAHGAPSAGPVGGRKQEGNAASSQRHPPHVTPNAENAPLQERHPSPTDVAVKGANAQGVGTVSTDEQALPIDEESMYARRPAEDKDHDPSSDGAA